MNTIRVHFPDEIETLKPILKVAYQSILEYQHNRTPKLESKMREAIRATIPILQIFKFEMPNYKRHYIEILEGGDDLSAYDLIVCFDRGIFELHARVQTGDLAHLPWSKRLREIFDERRLSALPNKPTGDETFLVCGTSASHGAVGGIAQVIHDPSEYSSLQPQSILVTPMTHPDISVVAGRIIGIVTDLGSILCHAAIIAREWKLPCIVGCQNATTVIQSGQHIWMDAASGIVTAFQETT
jgi:phosphohistidine swiveling domain-containing protein